MTGRSYETPMAPARPGRGRGSQAPAPAASGTDYDDLEVARGQSAAVLGALARMQLRLDVLAREQSDMLARVVALLEEINEKVTYEEDEEEAAVEPPHAPLSE